MIRLKSVWLFLRLLQCTCASWTRAQRAQNQCRQQSWQKLPCVPHTYAFWNIKPRNGR